MANDSSINKILTDGWIDEFICKIELGINFFEEAAEILVKLIDQDPEVHSKIMNQGGRKADWLTRDVLDTFEAIGRKQLAVQAIFLPKHVLNRVVCLPWENQIAVSTEPVPVVTGFMRGEHAVEHKPASQLSRKEAAIAIGPTGLRPISEQKKMIPPVVGIPVTKKCSIGLFELTLMNGKTFIKKLPVAISLDTPQAIQLNLEGRALIEIFERSK